MQLFVILLALLFPPPRCLCVLSEGPLCLTQVFPDRIFLRLLPILHLPCDASHLNHTILVVGFPRVRLGDLRMPSNLLFLRIFAKVPGNFAGKLSSPLDSGYFLTSDFGDSSVPFAFVQSKWVTGQ